MKPLFFILLGLLTLLSACGPGDESSGPIEDNRVCITNINNNPNVNIEQAAAEAEDEGLEVEEIVSDTNDVPLVDGPPAGFENVPVIRQVAICGSADDIQSITTNPQGREQLAAFLVAFGDEQVAQ